MQLFKADRKGDGWVATNGSRRRAKLVDLVEYPHVVVARFFRRRRGVQSASGVPASTDEVLERLARLPLSVWTYGFDDDSVRHLGPMSQDFAKAFGLGDNEREIDLLDANGVVMAACQALYRRVDHLSHELATLKAELNALKSTTGEAPATSEGGEDATLPASSIDAADT